MFQDRLIQDIIGKWACWYVQQALAIGDIRLIDLIQAFKLFEDNTSHGGPRALRSGIAPFKAALAESPLFPSEATTYIVSHVAGVPFEDAERLHLRTQTLLINGVVEYLLNHAHLFDEMLSSASGGRNK